MMATTMAMAVSSRVTAIPRSMGATKRYLPTSPHWKRPSVWVPRTTWEKTRLWTSMAANSRITTPATQRPGWRTGTIFMADGATDSPSLETVESRGSVIRVNPCRPRLAR